MPSDEIYEKAVNMATVVYQLQGEAEKTQFVPIHENVAKMLQVSVLHPTRVSMFNILSSRKNAKCSSKVVSLDILQPFP